MGERQNQDPPRSRFATLKNYYDRKMKSAYRQTNPRTTNWAHQSARLGGWWTRFSASMNLPAKSMVTFVGCWLLLEFGWPFIILLGVATAGSVWNIPATVPCMFIAVYGILHASMISLIREITIQLATERDNLVKALFRGYFWSLLSMGIVFLIHEYFTAKLPLLFHLPILYLLPIETSILGNGATVPIPIPLGWSGLYMGLLVTIIVYAVGIAGACIGGLELLLHVRRSSRQRGTYAIVFSILLLAVFPALNVYFSVTLVSSVLDLLRSWSILAP